MPDTLRASIDPSSDGIAVMHLTGQLDFASAPEARDRFTAASAEGRPLLIVDLSNVGFVDSAGLGSQIGSMRAARQAGGDLRITDPSEQAVSKPRCCSP